MYISGITLMAQKVAIQMSLKLTPCFNSIYSHFSASLTFFHFLPSSKRELLRAELPLRLSGGNFINIIRAHFLYENLFKAKTYLEKAAKTTFVQKIRM